MTTDLPEIPESLRRTMRVSQEGNKITIYFSYPDSGCGSQLGFFLTLLAKNGFDEKRAYLARDSLLEQFFNIHLHTFPEAKASAGIEATIDVVTHSCQLKNIGYISDEGRKRMQEKFDEATSENWQACRMRPSDGLRSITGAPISGKGILNQRAIAEGGLTLNFYPDDRLAAKDKKSGNAISLQRFEFTVNALTGQEPNFQVGAGQTTARLAAVAGGVKIKTRTT